MQKLIGILIIGFLLPYLPYAQGITDSEIELIATQLLTKLQSKTEVKAILISDFTNGDIEPTELGKFLSEEFGYWLSDAGTHFSIIDRSQLKKLLEEEKLKSDGYINPVTAAKLGRLKGMDSLLYGTLIDSGEYYSIYVKVIKVETMEQIASVRGKITKLPSLPKNAK